MAAAQAKAPAAFLSYAHRDDRFGEVTRLRERLAHAVGVALGEEFEIFQDRDGIAWGQHWPGRLDEALERAVFLIPILSPSFFASPHCRAELEKFLELERRAGRKDLILPIYLRTARPFEDKTDPLAARLSRRQYRDWRDLRHRPLDSSEVVQRLDQLADEIEAAIRRPAPAGEAGKRAPPPEGIAEGPPVHPPAAEPLPDLEPIEEERRVVRNVALRAAPALGADTVTRLKAGAVVYVAGRARDSGWLRIEGDGDLRGYVVADAVEPLELPAPRSSGNGGFQQLVQSADEIEAESQRLPRDETGGSTLPPEEAGNTSKRSSVAERPPDGSSIEREQQTVREAASRAGSQPETDGAGQLWEVPASRDRSSSIGGTAAANGRALREEQKDYGREPAGGAAGISAEIRRPAPGEPSKPPPGTRRRLRFIFAVSLSLGLAGLIVAVQSDWPSGRVSETGQEVLPGDLEPDAPAPPQAGNADVAEEVERPGRGVIERSGNYPEPLSVFKDCAECPEMVVLPGGTFLMGSPEGEEGRDDNEGPRREVTVAPFALGRYEVTFEEWDACVAAGGCARKLDDRGWGRGRRPVIDVSWNDAREYVAWLRRETGETYRLPSEAEWEYAARAGTTTRYWWGDAITPEHANYGGNVGQTTEVGRYPANAWGLHDTSGNVWEWVEDRWHENYEGAPSDGSAWLEGTNSARVVRGGSWSSRPRFLRAACRVGFEPDLRDLNLGFRVARMLTP